MVQKEENAVSVRKAVKSTFSAFFSFLSLAKSSTTQKNQLIKEINLTLLIITITIANKGLLRDMFFFDAADSIKLGKSLSARIQESSLRPSNYWLFTEGCRFLRY